MHSARVLPCVLSALVLAFGGGAAGEEGGVRGDEGRGSAAAGEPVAIPFPHRVGERWRIVLERREGPEGGAGSRTTETEIEAEVLSPYGRDLFVEVRALSVSEGGRRSSLEPRSTENAARLDARGGGRLALRVDRTGTAVDLLNAQETRAALTRVRGSVSDAAWPLERQALLEEWNTVYRACGVPLVPGRTVTTPLLDGAQREVGRDTRSLDLEPRAPGRVPALALTAFTAFEAPDGTGTAWSERLAARYDLDLQRLSGTSIVERREGGRATRVRLTFREAPVPAAPVLAVR